MPRVKKLDLGMTALDELFMNDKERSENKLPKIFDIPLSEIDDFPDHPYRVLDDEDMQNLMESIRDRGVITPAIDYGADRYFNSTYRRVQLGERMWVEISKHTYIKGLGVFKIPVTVMVRKSGLSERYWK